MDTSLTFAAANMQASTGVARQPISPASRTRCRIALLPGKRRDTSHATLEASATPIAVTSRSSKTRSPG
ncbi:MAG TPA: hypothetical protein VKU82_16140 [Planctomycetaceae bacterium]|nr:hypothetical protein [Planctomycetaceae bacterium]